MDAAQVPQTVLSALPNPRLGTPLRVTVPSGISTDPSTSRLPDLEAPVDTSMSLPQLIVAIFSMAALWDWMKLLLIGAFLESCRRGSAEAWAKLVDCVWVTGEFQSDGEAAGALFEQARMEMTVLTNALSCLLTQTG